MKQRTGKGKKVNKNIEFEKVTVFDKIKNIKDNSIAFRVRKFKENLAAHRKQLVIDVLHPNKPRLSNREIQNQICKMFGVNKDVVFVFAMRTTYDGNRSNGFALIYEDAELAKQYEPRHRLRKHGIKPPILPPKKHRKKPIKYRKNAKCA
ncbi:2455_t:CDS:2 [Entrophospora sp. SA101]|nr:2455_t:CDS:2 [Entrophospora sp. SA101]CAJ0845163.1 3080_t:CDS:2 [Entrophospora sp. SA101]